MNASSVETVTEITDDLVEAFRLLMPQLSPNTAPPNKAELTAILHSGCTTLLVARDCQGKIIGTLALAIFRTPTGIHSWIEDVVVDEAARGQGIGKALTQSAITLAKEKGAKSVNLTSHPRRQAANRLYQRMGFQQRETNVYILHLTK
ncbi:MAG: GNAT family N-acetyltransferase [Anaerolineae bacterium]|nr:GNAT family N-acetyltransferase [Anaerolineae bacterium]